MISEDKRREIEREAEDILKKFSASLKKVKISKNNNQNNDLGGFRNEGEASKTDSDFRERIFNNAPNKNANSIIAEKKEW